MLRWLFSVDYEEKSISQIIAWWEIRRIPYNAIIGISGIFSLTLYFIFLELSGHLKTGEDTIEPMALFIAPFLVNICFTAGWILESIIKIIRQSKFKRKSKQFMKLGVGFSLFVVSFPALYWGIYDLLILFGIIHGKA